MDILTLITNFAAGKKWEQASGSGTDADSGSARLISEVALFQIGSVLLPSSEFPLQIFSHKTQTQQMLMQIGKGGTFGVVFSLAGQGVRDAFAGVGCEAEIDTLMLLDDGRLILECTGRRRYVPCTCTCTCVLFHAHACCFMHMRAVSCTCVLFHGGIRTGHAAPR
jgi:hypothetical protein